MVKSTKTDFIAKLKSQVESHEVLSHPWFKKQQENFSCYDLYLWLGQEYHVSVSFVNWFLYTAALTDNQKSKIVLVQNIWEELGEGDASKTHVSILRDFLDKLSVPSQYRVLLPETDLYLKTMNAITQKSFYHGLGALGPANEYLLKLEYYQVSLLYTQWKSARPDLPEPAFFQVNLDADEGHSKKLFELIEEVSDSEEKMSMICVGNLQALEARLLFYQGLWNQIAK